MRDSLFLSVGFIAVEIGVTAATFIAAYELWIGDFVWSIQGNNNNWMNEEKQRVTIQSQRGGRTGHEPLYNTTRREYYDGSLSEAQKDTRRRGSTGDSTRRLFYKLILMALLCRLISFPIETFFVSRVINANQLILPTSKILLRASQTLPEIAFASAFGLQIIFCAQVAFAALPLSPQSSDSNLGADEEIVGNGNASPQPAREDGVADYGFSQQQIDRAVKLDTDELKLNWPQEFFHFCTRCSRIILVSKNTFFIWNTILLTSFLTVVVIAIAMPTVPIDEFEVCLWFVLIGVYSILSLVLIYVGAMLFKALRLGMLQRQDDNSLALRLRLIGMCALLAYVFLDRLISFGFVAQRGDYISLAAYRKNAIKYAFFELLPVLFILLIMHRKKKESNSQSDVLIIHSIMSSIFGSSGRLGNEQLDASLAPSEPSGGGSSSKGDLGSRRFQTYHGSTIRTDSFPPKVTKYGGNATSKMSTSKETSPLLTR